MKKYKNFLFGWCVGIVVFIFSVYFIALVVLPNVFDISKYKTILINQLEENTGFKYSVETIELKPSFSPYLNLYAHHLKVMYPNGDSLVKISDANVKIKVLPLLFRKIQVEKALLTRPIFNITLYSDCSTSLEKYLDTLKKDKEKKTTYLFSIDSKIPNLELTRYKLKIKDVNLYSPFAFEGDSLVLSNIDLQKSMHLKTKGALSSNKISYIKYDIDLDTFLPQNSEKRFFKVSPFSTILKYGVSSDVHVNLKVRDSGNKLDLRGEIKLSDFSFKIDNKKLSDNLIKLDFLGNEVDITADVKTSSTEKATVKGKFAFGLKTFLDVKVEALNANLSNLEELLIATLDSLNLKNNIREYKLSGLANLNFKIKTDFGHIQSQGTAEIINATLLSKKTPFKVTSINSKISFENDEITILKSKALVNSTPVQITGKINSNAIASIKVSATDLKLKNLLTEFALNNNFKNLDIQDGILSFAATAQGKLSDILLNTSVTIKNLKFIEKSSLTSVVMPTASINAEYKNEKFLGDISLFDVGFSLSKPNIIIKSKSLKLSLNDKDITILPADFTFGHSAIKADGKLLDYMNNPSLSVDFVGKMDSSEIYKMLSSIRPFSASAKGKLNICGNLQSKDSRLQLKSQVLSNSNSYISAFVVRELLNMPSILNIETELDNKEIIIKDISLYKAKKNQLDNRILSSNLIGSEKIIEMSGKILNTQNKELKNIRLFVPNSLTGSISGIKGSEVSLKSDLLINGTINSPKIKGALTINKFDIPNLKVNISDASMGFDTSNILLKVPYLRIGQSLCSLNANIDPKIGKVLLIKDTKMNISNLDLDELISDLGPILNSFYAPGVSLPVKVLSGNAMITKFSTEDLVAQNIKTDFTVSNNVLKMRKLTGQAYNGNIWGEIDYDFLSTMTKLNLGGKSLDAAPATRSLTGMSNVTGKLDFYSNVNMHGYSKRQKLKTLKGVSNLAIYNGQLGTLGKFEHFLYAQNLISQSLMKSTINLVSQAVAPKNTGRIRSLKAKISFDDGFAYIESLSSSGPNMSMYMSGRYNILNNWADIEILGKVSHEVVNVLGPLGELSLSNIVNNIPHFNNMSLPNIFYNNYNLQVSQETIDKIPDLTPKTGLKTKNFTVKIIGNAESVKSVKSFKWLALTGESPQVQTQQPVQSEVNYVHSATTTQPPQVSKPPVTKTVKELPSFLDNLPDSIR